MEKHLAKIQLAKQFFLKSLLINLAIILVVWILGTLMFNFFMDINLHLYNLEDDDYATAFVIVMSIWKLLIIQFALVPFLATMWLEKHIKKQSKKTKKSSQ